LHFSNSFLINLTFETNQSALATLTGIVDNTAITVAASLKLEHMALCSLINKVNNEKQLKYFQDII
jgi:hypothetical protein